MSVEVAPMRAVVDPAAVGDLHARLDSTRWPVAAAASAGADDPSPDWSTGVPDAWLRALVEDWRRFDVPGLQGRLDALDHVSVTIDGLALHAVVAKGRGADPCPVVLTHGWPGSCLEHLALVGPLTDPAAHGGDPAQSFDVVIPSLPGFGWSAPPPPGGLVAARVAELWHRLMTDGLGYRRYVAHGSDLGAGVTAWLARSHPDAVLGIHLATPGLAPPAPPWTPAETAHFAEAERWTAEEGGYAHQHSTRPATLAAGLLDSPVGLAAWIGEKVVAWSSAGPDRSLGYDRDLLLATLTVYWATRTIGTSMLPYWAYRHLPGAALPVDDPPAVPTAVSIFAGERVPFPKPPRELAARYFDLRSWTEHDTGGHFPAVAAPSVLAADLRRFFSPLWVR